MKKSSRSITLVLIGSTLVVAGCDGGAKAPAGPEEAGWAEGNPEGSGGSVESVATANDQYNQSGTRGYVGRSHSGVGGAIVGSMIGRSLGSGVAPSARPGPVATPTGPSARGGFGATGGGHSAAS